MFRDGSNTNDPDTLDMSNYSSREGMPSSQTWSSTKFRPETCTVRSHERERKAHKVISTFVTCVGTIFIGRAEYRAARGLHDRHVSTRKHGGQVSTRVLINLGEFWQGAQAFCSLSVLSSEPCRVLSKRADISLEAPSTWHRRGPQRVFVE